MFTSRPLPSLSALTSAIEGMRLGRKDLSTRERPMFRGLSPEAIHSKVVVQFEKITWAGSVCAPAMSLSLMGSPIGVVFISQLYLV